MRIYCIWFFFVTISSILFCFFYYLKTIFHFTIYDDVLFCFLFISLFVLWKFHNNLIWCKDKEEKKKINTRMISEEEEEILWTVAKKNKNKFDLWFDIIYSLSTEIENEKKLHKWLVSVLFIFYRLHCNKQQKQWINGFILIFYLFYGFINTMQQMTFSLINILLFLMGFF